MTETIAQLQADVDFLARRASRAGSFECDSKRSWGSSSNSLVSYAYGIGTPVMPFDWYDYQACVRACRQLPRHRRTKAVMLALKVQRDAVAEKKPAKQREGAPHA